MGDMILLCSTFLFFLLGFAIMKKVDTFMTGHHLYDR